MDRDIYGLTFKRARLDAARRLGMPGLEDRATAAAAMGLSDSFLKKVESGEKRPGFDTLETMARVYNVMPGDLLPSSAPSGPEVDRILAPILGLIEPTRSQFITQMEAFARILAAGMAQAQLIGEAASAVAEINAMPTYDRARNQPSSIQPAPNESDLAEIYGANVKGTAQPAENPNATNSRRHGQPPPPPPPLSRKRRP